MVNIGINEGINSSVVVEQNGEIVFAIQEERVNKVKNFMGFPHSALDFTINYLGLEKSDIESISFSNLRNTAIKTNESFLTSYNARADGNPLDPEMVKFNSLPYQEKNKIIEKELDKHSLGGIPIKRTHHHLNHAASAYFGMRKNSHEPHLVLTLDGGGDTDCSHVYYACNSDLRLIANTPGGHSIGNIYTNVTHYLGMTPHEHEYKVMGLAAYTKNENKQLLNIFRSYLDLDPDNTLTFKRKIEESTSQIAMRIAKDFKRQRFDYISGALQAFTEELIIKWVKEAVRKTGIRNVVVAGGVFMNVKVNSLISSLSELEYFNVFPSCGDETLPFGSLWLNYSKKPETKGEDIKFKSFCLGPDAGFDLPAAKKAFEGKLFFTEVISPEEIAANLLTQGNIVARCSKRMEFGARALGNRSILADPGNFDVTKKINKMIKQRDFFMPFAPSIRWENSDEYIKVPHTLGKDSISPYMMIAFDTQDNRSDFIAAIHLYDETTRAQIVTEEQYPEYHDLISRFHKKTNKSILLNTSFNLHGFPLVLGAMDAMEVMLKSSLEYLIINNTLVTKHPFRVSDFMCQ